MTSLDLQDAYFHILINPKSRQVMRGGTCIQVPIPSCVHQGSKTGTAIFSRVRFSAKRVPLRLAFEFKILLRVCTPSPEGLSSGQRDNQIDGSDPEIFDSPGPLQQASDYECQGTLKIHGKLVPFRRIHNYKSDFFSANSNATEQRNWIFLLSLCIYNPVFVILRFHITRCVPNKSMRTHIF